VTSDEEDDLLARAVAGFGARMGRPAGRGAARAVRFLRKDVAELDVVVGMAPEAAMARAREVIGEQGEIVHPEGTGGAPGGQVSGIVGSGAMNLNPAVVTVTVHPAPGGSRLAVRAAAMEGLIKQRAAAKAARRLAAALAPGAADPRPD
jgi:hypothetical protein